MNKFRNLIFKLNIYFKTIFNNENYVMFKFFKVVLIY